MKLKQIYLIVAIIGTVVPYFYFGRFFGQEGFLLGQLFLDMVTTDPARGAAADVSIASIAFMIFAVVEARRLGMKRWWWAIVGNLTVGLSLGLPLFLYMREWHFESQADVTG